MNSWNSDLQEQGSPPRRRANSIKDPQDHKVLRGVGEPRAL